MVIPRGNSNLPISSQPSKHVLTLVLMMGFQIDCHTYAPPVFSCSEGLHWNPSYQDFWLCLTMTNWRPTSFRQLVFYCLSIRAFHSNLLKNIQLQGIHFTRSYGRGRQNEDPTSMEPTFFLPKSKPSMTGFRFCPRSKCGLWTESALN